jgi:acetyl esterase/lipase
MNRLLAIALLIAGASHSALAAEPQTELLWPAGAPGALGTEAKDKPMLTIYLPEKEKASGVAVVVCPGGGYQHLAITYEGHDIARWLAGNGIAGFVCDYRHSGKGYKHPAPLEDAQRAIRTIRARAKEFHVDPAKIGILGFSAGGHLTSSAVTHFDKGKADDADPIQKVSCRPDFGILCYPVIAFGEKFSHVGSQHNLLGKDAPEELVKSMSSEKQVTAETPPCFLWHTYEDTGVPPENSIVFYLACIKHKVPAELHVYEKGRHGVGLGKGITGTENWPAECIAWMKNHGFAK